MSALSYDSPAALWLEALPLGNGTLGAMCWGGADVVRFDLNDETAWSGSPANESRQGGVGPEEAARLLDEARTLIGAGRPVDAERAVRAMQSDYSQAYLPLGRVTLRLPARSTTEYRRTLDLASAVHTVSTNADASDEIVQTTLVSKPHGVLMHVIDGLPAGVVPTVEIHSQLGELGRRDGALWLRLPSDVAPGHETRFPAASWSDEPGASLEAAIVTRVVTESHPATGVTRHRVVLFIATGTSYAGVGQTPVGTARDAELAAELRIDAAIAAGSAAVLAEHIADHRALFDRVSISLGEPPSAPSASSGARVAAAAGHGGGSLVADPALAALLFDYGRYLLIASSRAGGLPATLQGIWNDQMQPPWSSNYTTNINLQMNYWGADVANLPETAEPLFDFIEALAERGRDTARRLYGARGWVVHHNSDAWGFTAPAGGGTGDPAWAFWPMAGPWLIRHLREREAFGGGPLLATRFWPVLRGAAEFALDWMVRLPDGGWATSPSTSPENRFVCPDGSTASLSTSTTMDLSLLRELFQTVLSTAAERSAADRAGDLAFVREVRERLAAMPDALPLGSKRGIREWADDAPAADPHHRHLSHLYALYPGGVVPDEAVRLAAEQSLVDRGDDSTGWSLCWKLALWARLGRADKVSELLRLVFRPAESGAGPFAGGLYPNLFAAHPPFQIDGNLGFTAVLAEALLQSHDGTISLLPALPTELHCGSVTGFVARPGVLVDIEWVDGALRSATLRTRGAPVQARIRYAGRTTHRLIDTSGIRLSTTDFDESDTA